MTESCDVIGNSRETIQIVPKNYQVNIELSYKSLCNF